VKFLCVPCDQPMRLERRAGERGSIALTYACPACGYEMAMLTNPMETQLVGSLGVTLGGAGSPSKCPVTGMVEELAAAAPAAGGLAWSEAAERRMAGVPEFVKPMVRTGIESFARDKGYDRVDERVLDEARGFFGMD